ncbi:MAG: hypothetical protein CVT70_08855 [Alphaproteobacteria bacterium HGW-Alphaproteobacteria-1]|jgi:hypothetical protein|nr:MAG: hypothetical protein CVT70_08855 [Alphaproteobacteria bacterium HGW-Alphaproteobacteria-1]
MTKFGTIMLATIFGVTSAVSVAAQGAVVRQGNETALQMANRIGACADGSAILDANYAQNGTLLQVRCAGVGGDLSGGLGTAGAVALGVIGIAVVAAAASGGGGSSSTTGTNGTN